MDAGAINDALSARAHFSIAHDKGPLYLAIVVLLVLTALSIYSLRVFTHGKLHRYFATDDWLMLVAVVCAVGVVIAFTGALELGFGKQNWDSMKISPWIWALNLFHIVGLGTTKLSVAFYLLRIFERRYCSYSIYAMIGLLVPFTLEWFFSTLVQCVPIAAAWDPSHGSEVQCMSMSTSKSLALANHVINSLSSSVLVLLVVPILIRSSISFKKQIYLFVAVCLGLTACTAAVIRTQKVTNNIGYRGANNLSFTTWGVVEILLALLATNITTLLPLTKVIRKRRPSISPPMLIHPRPTNDPASYASRHSTQTVIYRPNTAYFPSHIQRFHDDESNLDFDIETQSSRTRTAPSQHTRNVSDWSQFSGFTYYTNATEERRVSGKRGRVSTLELEEIVKSLGLGRGSAGGLGEELYISDDKNQRDNEEVDDISECDEEEKKSSEEKGGRAAEVTADGVTTTDFAASTQGDEDSVSVHSDAHPSEVKVSRSRAHS